MKIKEYKLVAELKDWNEFNNKINNLLSEGWELKGDTFIKRIEPFTWFYQVMVLPEYEEKEITVCENTTVTGVELK